MSSSRRWFVLAALGACAPRAELPFAETPAGRAACGPPGDAPALALDVPVHSSAADQAARLREKCRNEPLETRRYHFTPPETATYRFAMHAAYPASLVIELAHPGARDGHMFALGPDDAGELPVTLAADQTYTVIVSKRSGESPPPPPPPPPPPVDLHDRRGPVDPSPPLPLPSDLALVIRRDASAAARILAEAPARAEPLIASARPLTTGRTFGTFESVTGGPRARCGGLGSGTVYAIDVAAPAVLTLQVAAQFPVALELRDRAGGSRGCARGDADRFEASLAARLPAGAYVLIVDTVALAPALFEQPRDVAVPGAGVRGGFVLDAGLAPGAGP